MGKFILCCGREAKIPFHFELTDTNVYTIEELCYYLYQNIYTITEDNFSMELVSWLRDELGMEEIGDKLRGLIENKNDLKDIVVSILCSSDYYTEEEIKSLIIVMDSIGGLPAVKRRKLKADNYLAYHNYIKAAEGYEKILNSDDASSLTCEDYGDILHNLSIARLHTTSFGEAADGFKEAYSRNHSEASLKQYFYALKLGRQDKRFLEEASNLQVSEEKLQEYISVINRTMMEAEELKEYKTLEKLKQYKEDGRVGDYYHNIDALMYSWKQEYRKEIR